jgi:ATP-dependent DNA helicase RecQ
MNASNITTSEIRSKLQKIFGFHNFRGKQGEIIEHLVAGEDALVVMATGSGKSLCYQLSGILRQGVTIVVSPLIALMRSQVAELEQLGLKAASWHSSLNWQQQQELESQLKVGELDFLYLSPEKLLSEEVQNILHNIDISLFAIDEAHCIWRWGHDFRPEYQQLSLLAKEFPRIPRVALTATAGTQCKQAIIAELGLDNAQVFVDQLDRPNLYYWIQPKKGANQQLLHFIQARHQSSSGIVYCQSRKKTDEAAEFLVSQGYSAAVYHAGLSAEQRWQNQQDFLSNKVKIMVATVAFGMGINKPDIRFVAHMDLPKNLESYYQEIGRAGRDNKSADAWMVFGLRDYQQLNQWIQQGEMEPLQSEWEFKQLQNLLKFVLQGNCRRQNLLGAFDVENVEACGHCDNCDHNYAIMNTTEDARLALSASYRCGQNYGIDHLIKVIRGQKAQTVLQAQHHQLELYGKGATQKVEYWRSIFLNLIQQQKLVLHGEFSELVKLAAGCKNLLAGKEIFENYPLSYFKNEDYAAHRSRDNYIEHPLFQALVKTRKMLAEENQLLDYQVVPESTLLEILNKIPKNISALEDIEALGKTKTKKYGAAFLQTVENYIQLQSEELKQFEEFLNASIQQETFEDYALENNLTMSELAAKLCEFIRLGLIKANQMLPISDDDWEIILQNWKPAKNQHQINENKNQLKAMGVVIPAYWYQCIQSHFKYRVD